MAIKVQAVNIADIIRGQQRQAASSTDTFRDQTLAKLEFHRRRVVDMEEVLRIIDEVGSDRFERLTALVNDKVGEETQAHGPHGEGCQCPADGEEDDTEGSIQ